MLHADEFEDLAMLLPFYVNGTLGARDCAKIDAALPKSSDLRNEMAVISQLAQKVKTGATYMTQDKNSDNSRLETVLNQLEDKLPVTPPMPAAQPAAPGNLLAFLSPKNWHPAVPLALALAIIAQAYILRSLNQRVDRLQFQLASGPQASQKGSLVVQLKGNAAWAQVEALLAKEGLSIVGGPSDGALTLSSTAKGAALDALMARLRASPLIAAVDKAA